MWWPLLPGTPLSSFRDLTLPFVTPRLDQEGWPLGGGRGLPNATPRALLRLTRSVSRVTSDGGSLLPKTPSSLALRQLSPSICTSSFCHRRLFLLFSSNVSDPPSPILSPVFILFYALPGEIWGYLLFPHPSPHGPLTLI